MNGLTVGAVVKVNISSIVLLHLNTATTKKHAVSIYTNTQMCNHTEDAELILPLTT